ncbi:hypothetical protein NDU88_004999 [Pleurodeles waltl]|uniref:Uncharacterized protein n=1 Tax=Pleurodeles waltl TaxID=8319 RepID=A0AAV7TTL5_PLEWA|nr:hypothetical protein NDU88_004999 [Pleurodeles waltl]
MISAGTRMRSWGTLALVDYRLASPEGLGNEQVCEEGGQPGALLETTRVRGGWLGGVVPAEGAGSWTVGRCRTPGWRNTPFRSGTQS